MSTTQQQLLDYLTVQLHEFDDMLQELAELRAAGEIDDAVAAQAHTDIRLLQDIAGPAIATGNLAAVNAQVTSACLRLMALAAQGSLF